MNRRAGCGKSARPDPWEPRGSNPLGRPDQSCCRYPKFADLPNEVDAEIRGLEEAWRRIAELERQIRKLKSSNAAPQIDHAAIERAVMAAIERERAAWRRKLEQSRARFQRMIGVVSSAGQAFEKLKVLLDEAEREWANLPAAAPVRDFSINHRSEPHPGCRRVFSICCEGNGEVTRRKKLVEAR